MSLKLLLASGNSHKACEFEKLFDSQTLEVSSAPEAIEVDESGASFNENAFLKAKAYFDKYQVPVVSDDSGIVIKALPDELGIHSARFGGEGLSDKDRALLLLDKMKSIPKESRSAYFICILCFYISDDEVYFFEGRMQGHIGEEYIGDHGFGYDPVLMPEGPHADKTIAMVPDWKNEHSHRAVACLHANKFFKERVCQI